MFATEIRFICYICGLYTAFIYWGYLQEKITAEKYVLETDATTMKWQFPFALNVFMALATFIVASVGDQLYNSPKVPLWAFAKPAVTCALGSPIGYMALDYISFPLVVLTKSSKPVPVMLVGVLLYRKKYPWYKYVSVLMLCGGISLFSFAKPGKGGKEIDLYTQIFGILLVGINVFLDGYTNNEQDFVFEKYKATSLQMMKYVNMWQILYLMIYLLMGYLIWGSESELRNAFFLFINCSQVRIDVFLFCICASVGQLFIFAVMKEFGSLTWVTLSITRKLFTIIVSVVMFNHSISTWQWLGVASVFLGMSLEVGMNYAGGKEKKSKEEGEIKKSK
jgi:solute carrier family 35 (UDP-galactose transporter), member B1